MPALPGAVVTVTDGGVGFPLTGGGAWVQKQTGFGVDGTASTTIVLSLGNQSTCAFGPVFYTGIDRANDRYVEVEVTVAGDQLPGPGTYSQTTWDEDAGFAPLELALGTVVADCNGGSNKQTPGSVTLTEVDAQHVVGTVSIGGPPSATVSFDAPFCPPAQGGSYCCVR